MTSEALQNALKWRYATKEFDSTKKLTDDQVNLLKESIRLAPSSFGLQPWKVLVISNQEILQKLRPLAWDQSQITNASHLFVFATHTQMNEAYVDQYIASTAQIRGITPEVLTGYADMMKGFIKTKTPTELIEWGAKQVYIALGFALETAALSQIDACPMEGFSSDGFDEVLGLKEKNLTSKVVCAFGFRSENDKTAQYAKSRFASEQIFIDLK